LGSDVLETNAVFDFDLFNELVRGLTLEKESAAEEVMLLVDMERAVPGREAIGSSIDTFRDRVEVIEPFEAFFMPAGVAEELERDREAPRGGTLMLRGE